MGFSNSPRIDRWHQFQGVLVALAVADAAQQGMIWDGFWAASPAGRGHPWVAGTTGMAIGSGCHGLVAVAQWLIDRDRGVDRPCPPLPDSPLGRAIAQVPLLLRYLDEPHQGLTLDFIPDALGTALATALTAVNPLAFAATIAHSPEPTSPGLVAQGLHILHQSQGNFSLALGTSLGLGPGRNSSTPLREASADNPGGDPWATFSAPLAGSCPDSYPGPFAESDSGGGNSLDTSPLLPLVTAMLCGGYRGLGAIPVPWRQTVAGDWWQQRWQLSGEAALLALGVNLWRGWGALPLQSLPQQEKPAAYNG